MDEAMLTALVKAGQVAADAMVREEEDIAWEPITQTRFAPVATGGAPLGAEPQQGGDALGYVILLAPFISGILVWLWIANMNLLQDPSAALLALTILTVAGTALLMAIEASQLGMGTRNDSRDKKGTGPIAWFFAACLVWFLAFPWYLDHRRYYGRKPLAVGGILVMLFFVISTSVVGAAIENKKAEVRRSFDYAQATVISVDTSTATPDLTPEQQRTKAADAVWAQFDSLSGPQFRTKEMLRAHLLQANQIANGLPGDESARVVEYNREQFRKRLPGVLIVGERGTAAGPRSTIIAPSLDPDRCAKLGAAWAASPMRQELNADGYTHILCLDAKGEAGKNWPLTP